MAEPPNSGALPSAIQPTVEARIVKKRNRIAVSCGPCRVRRSKCDRKQPCESCKKEPHLCVYAKPVEKPKPEHHGRRLAGYGAQARLQQLENMVTQLLDKDQPTPTAPPPYQDANIALTGYHSTPTTFSDPNHPTATSNSTPPHWTTVLKAIQDVQSAMQQENGSPGPPDGIVTMTDRPVLLAIAQPYALRTILDDYLPRREDCKERLLIYFRSKYITIPVLHPVVFDIQYSEFWLTREHSDPVWCALLFALLSLSAHITKITGASNENQNAEQYLHASAACLHLAGFSQPRPHLIPAMLLLAQSIYMQNHDPSREVALILSMIVRLAFMSGLHHEQPPSKRSVFEAELDRRLWVMVRHFDLQCACQFGVPQAVPHNSHNVKEPRNLTDSDLSLDMTALPASRPESEATQVLGFLVKNRIMNVFAEIYSRACDTRDPLSDAEIQRLDAALRKQRDEIPEPYRSQSVEQNFATEEYVVMARFTVELLAQKSLCILHRNKMTQGNVESKAACMEAAVTILERMNDLVAELRPGGLLQGRSWMITSTNINDFLFATSVLCVGFVTNDQSKTSRSGKMNDNDEDAQMLNKARKLCLDHNLKSRATARVAKAVSLVLQKMGFEHDQNVDPSLGTSQATTSPLVAPTAAAAQEPYSQGAPSTFVPTTMSCPMPVSSRAMSNDAMSSLAAAATAQLGGEIGSDLVRLSQATSTQQSYGGLAYSWANTGTTAPDAQFQYPGNYQDVPQQVQTQPAAFDPFEQLFPNYGQADGGKAPDVNWAVLDQFITAGDSMEWDQFV